MTTRVATKDEVRKLQLALQARGFVPGPIDGVFGTRTKLAVSDYQAALGQPVTGTPSFEMLVELGVIAPPVPPPKKSNPISDFLTGLVVKAAVSKLKGALPMNILTGYKTYITAVLAVLVGGLALVGITLPGFENVDAGTMFTLAFGLIFGRVGAVKQ